MATGTADQLKAPVNLLDTTNPRRIAQAGFDILSEIRSKTGRVENFRFFWGSQQILRAEYRHAHQDELENLAKEWWNDFTTKFSPRDGQLDQMGHEQALRGEFSATVSSFLLSLPLKFEGREFERMWAIVNGAEENGIKLTQSQRDGMHKVVFECVIAKYLMTPDIVDEKKKWEWMMIAAAYPLIRSPNASQVLQEYNEAKPVVLSPFYPRPTVSENENFLDRIGDLKETLAQIIAKKKAQDAWNKAGVKVPVGVRLQLIDKPDRKPGETIPGVFYTVKDKEGERAVEWHADGEYPIVVSRRSVRRQPSGGDLTFEITVGTVADLSDDSGIVSISIPDEKGIDPGAYFDFIVQNGRIVDTRGLQGATLSEQLISAGIALHIPDMWSQPGSRYYHIATSIASCANEPIDRIVEGRMFTSLSRLKRGIY